MSQTRKLTKWQKRLLEKARRSPVMVTHHPEFQDKWTTQNGQSVNPNTARALIELGLLVPCRDGLFDGASQTYWPANASASRGEAPRREQTLATAAVDTPDPMEAS